MAIFIPPTKTPATELGTKPEEQTKTQQIKELGIGGSLHETIKKTQSKLDYFGKSKMPRGQIELDSQTFLTSDMVYIWPRVCISGASTHNRDSGGTRIYATNDFVNGNNILRSHRSDEYKVKRDEKGIPLPGQKQMSANYNSNFSSNLENIAFNCNRWRANGVHWGFAQCSFIKNCEFRFGKEYGLELGNGSTRGYLEALTFAWSPTGLKFNRCGTITGNCFSFLRSLKGIEIDTCKGIHLTGISTEHVDTVLTVNGNVSDIKLESLHIALTHQDRPIFDFSGITNKNSYVGVKISGTIRKTPKVKDETGNIIKPFYIDKNGKKQSFKIFVIRDGEKKKIEMTNSHFQNPRYFELDF